MILRNKLSHALWMLGWAGTVAAPLVAHWTLATGRWMPLAVALAACQVVTISSLALRRRRAGMGLAAAGILALLLLRLGSGVPEDGLVAASGLSHAMIYLSLIAVFGRTLQRGRTPLITGLAQRLRGALPPGISAYTRRVTVVWCGFFATQLAASLALFLLAPLPVWSFFVNVLDFPLVVLMFAAEYGVRRALFRNQPHITVSQTIQAFARGNAGRAA